MTAPYPGLGHAVQFRLEFFNIRPIKAIHPRMLTNCPKSEAAALPLSEVSTPTVTTNSQKDRGLLGRLRRRSTEQVVRSCLQILATDQPNQTGPQMAAWLSTVPEYGAALLDPAFLSMEQAQRAAKIMRRNDPGFALKMLKGLSDESAADVMRRALLLLDTARDT